MIITCEKCKTKFRIDKQVIGMKSKKFRCNVCQNVWEYSEAIKNPSDDAAIRRLEELIDKMEISLKVVLKSIQMVEISYKDDVEPPQNLADGENEKGHEVQICDVSTAAPLFIELDRLLEQNDLDAEDCMASIKKCLGGSIYKNELRSLEDQIDRLDFKIARHTLKKISDNMGISLNEEDSRAGSDIL